GRRGDHDVRGVLGRGGAESLERVGERLALERLLVPFDRPDVARAQHSGGDERSEQRQTAAFLQYFSALTIHYRSPRADDCEAAGYGEPLSIHSTIAERSSSFTCPCGGIGT